MFMRAIVGIENCFRACRTLRGMSFNKREERKEIAKTEQKRERKKHAERIGKSLCMRFYFFQFFVSEFSSLVASWEHTDFFSLFLYLSLSFLPDWTLDGTAMHTTEVIFNNA